MNRPYDQERDFDPESCWYTSSQFGYVLAIVFAVLFVIICISQIGRLG